MIIAGEISGDERAAALVDALRPLAPAYRLFGIGGPALRAVGVETLVDVADMAVMGISEVLRRYGFFRRVFNQMLREVETRRPQAVILVDYPGFNLRFAKRVHAMGVKVIYYVCPQVWAWHQSRIPKMAAMLDRLITIFPFEARYFANTGLRVDFAGHPLVDEAARTWSAPSPALPWASNTRVALLPGSREHEIRRLLPDMLAAAQRIAAEEPNASFLIPTPTPAIRACVEKIMASGSVSPSLRGESTLGSLRIAVVSGEARQVLRQAHAAIVASGTATLETSLMLCPMIVVYRVSALTYAIARRVVRVPHIGIVNIVAGREVCPEFIQDAVRPAPMANAVLKLLRDPAHAQRVRTDLQAVNQALGSGGAAARAAASVLDELQR